MLAADTIGLLDALEIEKAAFLGHSMGGFIAQAIALDYPERVSRSDLMLDELWRPQSCAGDAGSLAGALRYNQRSADPIYEWFEGEHCPRMGEEHPVIVQEWVSWRVANPIDMAGYQSQMAIGLGLIPAEACFEGKNGANLNANADYLW